MLRRLIPSFPALLLATYALLPGTHHVAEALTIGNAFQYRGHEGPNSLGLVVGDRLVVVANPVDPAGPPTTVVATQGATSFALLEQVAFPPQQPYARSIPFNPALTGPWLLQATRGADTAIAFTPSLANPQLVPLVLNLRTTGSGFHPTVEWDLPSLAGFDIDQIRVTIFDDGANQQVFSSPGLAVTTTSYSVPDGALQLDHEYVFDVQLLDFGTFSIENRSSTFTLTPYAVPVPSTLLLLTSGLGVALAVRRARQSSIDASA
jgi:hypothetical protein